MTLLTSGPTSPSGTTGDTTPSGGGVRLDPIDDALDALRRGRPVIVVDDADRENEGDVILAAVHADAHWMGWTVRHTSGLICAPLPDEIADRLDLPPMVTRNQDPRRTAYTVTVDAAHGVTTGISATDRARTVRLLADPGTGPADLVRPGHVLPLRARPGGVLERRGHTEAAVDLCRLAGLPPVGVIAEVVTDTGEIMRAPGLRALADSNDLPMISIDDLAAHRGTTAGAEPAPPGPAPDRVARVAESVLPTAHGRLRVLGYRDLVTGQAHLALVGLGSGSGIGSGAEEGAGRGSGNGQVSGAEDGGSGATLVRVHSECLTGDALGSLRCDCGPQLETALERVAAERGVLIYLGGHEGRGIGLLAKLTAYGLQDRGLDTVAANLEQGLPADAREYGAAAAVLADLGVGPVRLLTNNPAKVDGLEEHGVRVVERVPLAVGHGAANRGYLRAKRDLMGHLLDLDPVLGTEPGTDPVPPGTPVIPPAPPEPPEPADADPGASSSLRGIR
jgi:3,4-dihydroxy 2-butanone 4-phosphate synthase / GTP cyclohydrolase II